MVSGSLGYRQAGCQDGTDDFKSAGEAQIARMLGRYGIHYSYEQPVAVVDRGKTRVWYPDFTLPDYGLLVEFYGRADDPAYARGMARKQRVYEENGLSVIALGPEDLRGDWPNRILDRIEGVLLERLEDLGARRFGSRAGKRVARR